MVYLLDPQQREVLAKSVNAALLERQGLSGEAGLEAILRRTRDYLQQLKQRGNGCAAFLSVEDYLS
jgi:hypothetical protein